MSASEDGTVRQFDLRLSSANKSTFILRQPDEVNDAIYHPLTPDLFAMADNSSRMLLLDARSIRNDGSQASSMALVRVRPNLLRLFPTGFSLTHRLL